MLLRIEFGRAVMDPGLKVRGLKARPYLTLAPSMLYLNSEQPIACQEEECPSVLGAPSCKR